MTENNLIHRFAVPLPLLREGLIVADDELVEVTPKTIRLRKRILDHSVRMKNFMKDKKQ